MDFMEQAKRIAVFIDADNAPAKEFSKVLSELAKYGLVSIRKAYGNWTSPTLKSWEALLHEHAIQPIQQYDLTKGKNASDIALVIDAMDVLYTKDIDIICLVSSDCDFTPLVTRVLAEGKVVLGFGERKTPEAFVNACSKFLFLGTPSQEAPSPTNSEKNIKSDAKLITLLRQAIEATEEDDGWAQLGPIGSHISNHASFDQQNYGFKKLSDLFQAIDLFEMKKVNSALWVRDKKRSKQRQQLNQSSVPA